MEKNMTQIRQILKIFMISSLLVGNQEYGKILYVAKFG